MIVHKENYWHHKHRLHYKLCKLGFSAISEHLYLPRFGYYVKFYISWRAYGAYMLWRYVLWSLWHYYGGLLLSISYHRKFLVKILCIRYRDRIGRSLWVVLTGLNKWGSMPLGWKSLNPRGTASNWLSRAAGEELEKSRHWQNTTGYIIY